MSAIPYRSWGQAASAGQKAIKLVRREMPLPLDPTSAVTCLPYGNGRSYGDSCLNGGGLLLDCRGLDRLISFDDATGILRCEAGMLLCDITRITLPKGWFLPVTPGTELVTIGGAIANDVHGKNHHRAGTFGHHVRAFELLRSDGSRRLCTPTENPDWFRATVAGLGLTGVITWAEIQLRPADGAFIDQETIRFRSLDEFFSLSRESGPKFEYTVAWVDSLASGRSFGRGLFMRGNHAQTNATDPVALNGAHLRIPFEPPVSLINRWTLKAFNEFYYRRQIRRRSRRLTHYRTFFYPLDGIGDWNRLYGPRGLVQHQSVLPHATAADAVAEMLERARRAGHASFLTVLKEFGDHPAAGLMSFPRAGYTLALDFASLGPGTSALLDELDAVTLQAGGVVNIYKDGRMSAETFQAFYPRWRELAAFADPCFMSDFWRRVTAGART
ncbi:MAG: FAD-binding oxidoreductase [Pseudomonadota bacterium]|nr:FAD-binding oxidoreductase [Pseudomonadota bacterium]